MGGGWETGIQTFIAHVLDGTQPDCDGAAGRSALQIVQAAYESDRTGCKIVLDDVT